MPDTGSSATSEALRPATRDWYRNYYARKGADRNSLLRNPEVLFQNLAQDAALVRSLQSTELDPLSARVLDVGCGNGVSLWNLLRLGFKTSNLFGVDIQEDRILQAKAINPQVTFDCADATSLKFSDDTFDLVMESTLFLQTDDDVTRRIALEMIRVTKPGGILLVSDWRYAKPGSGAKGVSSKRVAELYQVGIQTAKCQTFRGSLVPPLGRFLSRHLPSAYFVIQALFPFLTGHMVTILRKSKNS